MMMESEMNHAGTHRPYRPSNGTEGEMFMADWCDGCAQNDDGCMIQLYALAHSIGDPDYPAEWNYTNGGVPQCTAFTRDTPQEPRCDKTMDMFPAPDGADLATLGNGD